MKPNESWELVGIHSNAREAARAAARRAGVSVGEWLTERILGDLSGQGVREQDETYDELVGHISELTTRLRDVEDQIHADSMREAVKKLHQGLSRLANELVQSAGQSAIQISTMAGELQSFGGKLEDVRTEATGLVGAVVQRIDQIADQSAAEKSAFTGEIHGLSAKLDDVRTHAAEAAGVLLQRITQVANQSASALSGEVESLTGRLENIRSEASGAAVALEQRLAHMAEQATAQNSTLGDKLENLSGRLNEVSTEASSASLALENRLGRIEDQSAIQNSTLARNVDNLNTILTVVRTEASGASEALSQRLNLVQQGLDSLDARHIDFSKSHAVKLEGLSERLDGVHLETSKASDALAQSLATAHQGLQNLENRHGDLIQSLAGDLEGLRGRLDSVHTETSKTSDALEQGLASLRKSMESQGVLHSNATQSLAGELEDLSHGLDAIRTETSRTSGALEQRLTSLQKAAERQDTLQSEALQALAGKLESLNAKLEGIRAEASDQSGVLGQHLMQVAEQSATQISSLAGKLEGLSGRFENVRAETSGRSDAIEQCLMMVQKGLEGLDARQIEAVQALNQLPGREAATKAAISKIEENIASIERRASDNTTDARLAGLERNFSQLLGRTEVAENTLSSLPATANAVEDTLRVFSERLNAAEKKQQDAIVELQAALLKEIQKALGAKPEIDTREQSDAASIIETPQETTAQQSGAQISEAAVEGGSHDDIEPRAVGTIASEPPPLVQHLAITPDAPGNALEAGSEVRDPATTEISQVLADNREHQVTDLGRHDDAMVTPPFVESNATTDDSASAPDLEGGFPAAQVTASPEVSITRRALTKVGDYEWDDFASDLPPHIEPTAPGTDVIPMALSFDGEPADIIVSEATVSDPAAQQLPPMAYLSAARKSARDAAELAEAGSNPRGFFGIGRQHGAPSPAGGRLKEASIGLVAAVVFVAIAAAGASVFLRHTSALPRAIAGEGSRAFDRSAKQAAVQPHPTASTADRLSMNEGKNVTSADLATSANSSASASDAKLSGPTRLDQLASLADAGNARAQLMIGLRYLNNEGGPARYAEAAKWLQLAATNGEALAQYRLGTLYAGGHGVPTDAAKALYWYEASAKAGNRKAMYNLAVAYTQGNGVTRNPTEAARWFSKAANMGLVDAQFDLAVLYERGNGVPQSLLDAYRWYAIAAKQGDHESKERIDALATQISADDRAAAEAAVAQFKNIPLDPRANAAPQPGSVL